MATIDLGKIKIVWRGTYAGGTAYTVDDAVEHTDSGITSSFICTTATTGNAPSTGGSVHSSWAYLAKGAAGSVLTTQGDILYRDGSGDARLGFGTSGHVLTTKGTGANPVWEAAVGGKVGQCTQFVQRAVQQVTSHHAFTTVMPNFAHSMTPSAATSKILVEMQFVIGDNNWVDFALFSKVTSGGTYAIVTNATASATGGGNKVAATLGGGYAAGHNNTARSFFMSYLDSPATTSEMFYTLCTNSESTGNHYLNRSWTDGNYHSVGRYVSTITLSEILA